MKSLRNLLIGYALVCVSYTRGETGECQVFEDGSTQCPHQSQHKNELCQTPASLYSWGGTAVAYRPDVSLQSNVCTNQSKYNVASWFIRRASWSVAPRITLKVHVNVCEVANDTTCICSKSIDDYSVEVWQAQPDGTYPSLRGDSDDCRAKQTGSRNSVLTFETLAPGSTGSMGGLGPSGFDVGPYRPPLIHILVRKANGSEATLIDIPIAVHPKTLEQISFWGPDFSGTAWTRSKQAKNFEISLWNAVPAENRAEVEVNIFLPPSNEEKGMPMCPSLLYGSPKSFFREPIAVCAPSMLNFFPL